MDVQERLNYQLPRGKTKQDQGRLLEKKRGCSKQDQGPYNVHALLTYLKSCSLRRQLRWGRRIHAKAVESGRDSDIYLVTALVKMYANCGIIADARSLFESIEKPDLVAWTTLLLGYAENGEGYTALQLYSSMKMYGCMPDSATYVAILKACTSLAVNEGANCLTWGRKIHAEMCCRLDQHVQNTLIDMYGKCGSIVEAQVVFDSIQEPDVVSWNALLLGYTENGQEITALELFSRMKLRGCVPDNVTYLAAIKACTYLAVTGDGSGIQAGLEQGRKIHSEIRSHMCHNLSNTLIDMYAKCGSMIEARSVFDTIKQPNVVAWTALLFGYLENGEAMLALDLFTNMKAHGCVPDAIAYVAAIKACTSLAVNGEKTDSLKRGRVIHSEIGCHLDDYVRNTLVDMYAKCGSMVDAQFVFDTAQIPDLVSWNALLMGYAENGQASIALELFSRMKASGCVPDSVTYIAALKACTENGDCLDTGREIHSEIGRHSCVYVQNTLISMYSRYGSLLDACNVFDSIQNPDVVSWNTLLLGHTENGEGLIALELFSRMNARGCAPDSVTYLAALNACGLTGALELGRKLHLEIREFTAHIVTCLVDFYSKCGSIGEARQVFDLHSSSRDLSTWNALLSGYSRFGDSGCVFNLFEVMQDEGFLPDAVTFVCMLMCCGHAGLVEKAREYFEVVPVKYGVTPTVIHYTCMVDVFGRANRLNEAIALLYQMPCNPDGVTWKALLGACRKWKNVQIGRMAFQALLGMDKKDASVHVLMAQIYGSRGMWEEQEKVLEMNEHNQKNTK